MAELGPNEGKNRLRHPECRSCDESERLNLGIMAQNRSLREHLAKQVEAELHSEEPTTRLDGPLGEAISEEAGSCSLEFVTPEQLAKGIATWIREGGNG